MMGSLMLSAEAPAEGILCFPVRSVRHARCECLAYLHRLPILFSERLISGVCFFNIFFIFW
jgi:hypothetical protein